MKKRMAITIILLVVVFGAIFGWKAVERYFIGQYFANFQPPPVTVSAAEATVDSWQPRVEAVGSLAAVQGVEVSAEVAGIVRDIRFQSGDRVEAGALLVQLDDSAEQAELPGLRARLRQAEQNLRRNREVVGQGLAAQQALDAAQSEYDQAQSAVRTREVSIAKKAVRAPFAGTLGIRRVNVGEYLQPGTPIVSLQSLDPLYVNFTLPQQQLGRVASGQTLQVHLDAFPDTVFTGRIAAVSPAVDPASRNFAVQGEIANPDGRLRPGMFADIRVVTGEPAERVTVPRTAISYSLYGDSVYVVTQPEGSDMPVAEERFVRTGEERAGRVAILEGVRAGESVVTAGQLKLQDGSRLVIDNDVELD